MCRFVAYLGREVLLEQVLVKPENSLVRQSIRAREQSSVPTNGDGFGVGWYAPVVNEYPALFTSIFPAWSDKNLLNLTAKIASPCFFGHVRAASVGGINPYNCHPFIYKRWMLMHNGDVGNFCNVKRHLRRLLDDEYYHWIQGETDSEHIFALFLQLAKGKNLDDMNQVADVMRETINELNHLVSVYGEGAPSYINLCLTDGLQMLAVRYCSDPNKKFESLHYFVGYGDATSPLRARSHEEEKPTFILVASEKLTHWTGRWQTIPEDHFLLVDAYRATKLVEI
jgi:glutamine amidotransferase